MGTGPTDDADFPDIAGIDAGQARLRLDGDVELFDSILRTLVEQFGDGVGSVRQDLMAGRLTEAARGLHRLRGAVGAVSAENLVGLCTEAETALREGWTHAVPPLLEAIEPALAALLAAVRGYLANRPAAVDDVVPPVDAAAFAALLRALCERNADAFDQFARLRGGIAARCGRDAADQCASAIDRLRFEAAAEILSQAWSGGADPIADGHSFRV